MVDQVLPEAYEDVKVAVPPEQTPTNDPSKMLGGAGAFGSVSCTDKGFDAHPFKSVKLKIYTPADKLPAVYGKLIPLSEPFTGPDQLMFPVPEAPIVIDPVVVAQVDGFVVSVVVITGS